MSERGDVPANTLSGDTGNLYRCPECKRLAGSHLLDCSVGKAEAATRAVAASSGSEEA